MNWTIKFTAKADKNFAKLEKTMQKRVIAKLEEISKLENPRNIGKALTGNLAGLWRYRVGDYRLVCDIRNSEIVIVVVDVNHRSKVYD